MIGQKFRIREHPESMYVVESVSIPAGSLKNMTGETVIVTYRHVDGDDRYSRTMESFHERMEEIT